MADPTSRTFAATHTDHLTRSGRLTWPGGAAACVFGRSGPIAASEKREGDGASPVGLFPMREAFWRPDRIMRPETGLKATPLTAGMGWCDAPDSPLYNQRVDLPFAASHERLWREDHLYDLIVVLGWNDDPPEPGRGSAIFLHVASPAGTPTEGCVATDVGALLEVLKAARPGDALQISASLP